MLNEKVEKMEDGKDKELMKLVADGGKPYIKKMDGMAVKVAEDKEITYKDYEGQENTMKVPAGSYIVTQGDSCYPKIVTAEEFESNNKMLEESKAVKKDEKTPGIGIESIG
nr:hypothetical protein [uncultured Draconibacterium sp.]